MPFLEDIRRAIQQHRLITPGETVIVGVSGGADSIALLYVLHTLSVNLHIATLDHGWRGAQSAADADYVAGLAERLSLPVTRRRADLGAVDSGQEAAARHARYTFFAEVAQSVGARTVAVGHHADDQAETVLMKILRGAGVHGLGGMRWQAPLPYADDELRLVRPLLGVTRQQIEDYCRAYNLHPRQDITNEDPSYWRNRVRLEVLPYLDKHVSGDLRGRLAQLADVARVESDYIEQAADRWLAAYTHQQDERWFMDREAFMAAHPALQRRALAELVTRVAPVNVDYAHLVHAQHIAKTGNVGAVAQFSGGGRVRVGYALLIIEPENAADLPEVYMSSDAVLPLAVGQPVQLGGQALRVSADTNSAGRAIGQLYLSGEAALHLRTRRPGDRIAPPGMNGHSRKLKDWMIDRKIPAAHRDHIPLLICEDKIAAVLHPSSGIVAHPYHLSRPGTENRLLTLILS